MVLYLFNCTCRVSVCKTLLWLIGRGDITELLDVAGCNDSKSETIRAVLRAAGEAEVGLQASATPPQSHQVPHNTHVQWRLM